MAIAFNAAAFGGHVTSTTSQTWAFTVGAGSNRLLMVGVVGDITSDFISGVTYNGVAMTLVDKQHVTSNRWQYLYYLLNPASGSNNIVVSASSACDYIDSVAADYTGVQQTGNPDATTKAISANSAVSVTTAITTVADNDWTILFELGFSGDFTAPPAASTGCTRRTFDSEIGTCGLFDSGGVITPAGSYSETTTRPSSGAWSQGHIIAAFQPDTGASNTLSAQQILMM